MNFMSSTPPPNPSADAIQAAHALLAIVADPKGAKQRLDELVGAHENIKAAHTALEVERKRLIDENARAADLKAKENLLANKQADLEKFATANNVAAAALADREGKCAAAEAALKTKQDAHEADVKAFNTKVANMRAAIA